MTAPALSSRQRTVLRVGLPPVLALLVGGGAIVATALAGSLPFTYSSSAMAPRRTLVVQATGGPVSVRPSSDSRVHVDANGTWTSSRPTIGLTPSGESLLVSVACGECDLTLEVRMPPTLDLLAKTTNGSISASGLAGDVALTTVNGSISTSGLAGDVALNTRQRLGGRDQPDRTKRFGNLAERLDRS